MHTNAGTPYPEVTGPICRVPLAAFSLSALGFSPGVPVSVLGTDVQDPISCLAFHGLLELIKPSKEGRSQDCSGSPHYKTLQTCLD